MERQYSAAKRRLQLHKGQSGNGRRGGRAVIAGGAAVAFFVPMAIVASGGPDAGAAPSNANPHGVLKYGFDINDEFSNFDPRTETNDCGYTVMSLIYQSMTSPGQYAISGGVAKSWTISPNAETVTFTLRPGIKYSNGQAVTAADVEASLENTEKSPLRSSLSAISTITSPNPQTVVVQLSRPTAGDFLWALSYIDGSIYPSSTIATAATQPIGAGPYMLKSYQPGSSIDLVKNPNYWNSSAYPLPAVDFVQVGIGPQAVSAITSGAVDMISLDPEQYSQVKHDSNLGIAITQSYDYITMSTRNNMAPFNNEKVRAALEYSVNRAEINKVVFAGVGRPAYQPFPPNSPGYNKSVGSKYQYDPKKAKAMLAAAGFPHGVPFKLIVPSGDTTLQRLATVMQSEMAAAGFKASIQLLEPSDLLTDVYLHGQGDALLTANLTNGPDISNAFESEYEPTGFPAHFLGTEDDAIAPEIEAANASDAASLQGPLMQKVGATVMAQGLETPIEFEPSIIAYNKSVVGGKVVAPIGQCRSNLTGIYIKK